LGKFVDEVLAVQNLEEAIEKSFNLATKGESVIYSPGCVNEDGYLNYVDRGRSFEKYVKELKEV